MTLHYLIGKGPGRLLSVWFFITQNLRWTECLWFPCLLGLRIIKCVVNFSEFNEIGVAVTGLHLMSRLNGGGL